MRYDANFLGCIFVLLLALTKASSFNRSKIAKTNFSKSRTSRSIFDFSQVLSSFSKLTEGEGERERETEFSFNLRYNFCERPRRVERSKKEELTLGRKKRSKRNQEGRRGEENTFQVKSHEIREKLCNNFFSLFLFVCFFIYLFQLPFQVAISSSNWNE